MTKPGEQYYPPGVRWDAEIARGTLPDLLAQAAQAPSSESSAPSSVKDADDDDDDDETKTSTTKIKPFPHEVVRRRITSSEAMHHAFREV